MAGCVALSKLQQGSGNKVAIKDKCTSSPDVLVSFSSKFLFQLPYCYLLH